MLPSYSSLYREKMQEAEWFKKPEARMAIKVSAVVTIIALIVIASLSAHALSSSLSSIGTIGHNLVGAQGLVAVTATGFVGAPVLLVLLVVYLRKSIFRVSDYIHEDRGYLYAIKDENQKIVGYLYGTVHMMPQNWKGINLQIKKILNGCRKVIVECHEIPEEKGCISLTGMLGTQRGIDFKIMDYAHENKIPLDQLETRNEQTRILQSFFANWVQGVKNNSKSIQTPMSMDEAIDRLLVSWQTGDERSVSNMLLPLTNGRNLNEVDPNMKSAYKNLTHSRNKNWMTPIQRELQQKNESPIFIAVGCMHLFDFDTIETTGLITLIRNLGCTVERVG